MKIHLNYILFLHNYDNSSNDLNNTMLLLVHIVKSVARIKWKPEKRLFYFSTKPIYSRPFDQNVKPNLSTLAKPTRNTCGAQLGYLSRVITISSVEQKVHRSKLPGDCCKSWTKVCGVECKQGVTDWIFTVQHDRDRENQVVLVCECLSEYKPSASLMIAKPSWRCRARTLWKEG